MGANIATRVEFLADEHEKRQHALNGATELVLQWHKASINSAKFPPWVAVKIRFLFCPFFFVKKFFGAKKTHIKKVLMQPFSIKCFKPGSGFPASCFFILSKGRNTGRPSCSPNTNCFVFTCAPGDVQRYYSMVYALWKTGGFLPFLVGSVIEFIHIRDLKNILVKSSLAIHDIEKELPTLQKLMALETKLKKQTELIQFTRQILFSRIHRTAS